MDVSNAMKSINPFTAGVPVIMNHITNVHIKVETNGFIQFHGTKVTIRCYWQKPRLLMLEMESQVEFKILSKGSKLISYVVNGC